MSSIPLDVIHLIATFSDDVMCALYPYIGLTPRHSLLMRSIELGNESVFNACKPPCVNLDVSIHCCRYGRFKMLKSIYADAPINPLLLELSVENKLVQTVYNLVADGVPISNQCIQYAIKNGDGDMVQYLIEQSDPCVITDLTDEFWVASSLVYRYTPYTMWKLRDIMITLYSDYRCQPPISPLELEELFQN